MITLVTPSNVPRTGEITTRGIAGRTAPKYPLAPYFSYSDRGIAIKFSAAVYTN